MGRPNEIINGIIDHLERKGIEIDEPTNLKLSLLGNLIYDYRECVKNVRDNGILMNFNNGKTQGLNPCYKAKNEAIKLIIKLLGEICPKVKEEDEEEDDTEAFIYSLTHDVNLDE